MKGLSLVEEYQAVIKDLGQVPALAAQIEQCAAEAGSPAEKQMDIRLCASEALYNALIHGNGLDAAKSVRVSWRASHGELWLTVADEGQGVPLDLRHPQVLEEAALFCESGKGIYLINQLAQAVTFNERGNEITMRLTWSGSGKCERK